MGDFAVEPDAHKVHSGRRKEIALRLGRKIEVYITMGITLESSKIKISIVIALSIFHLTGTFRFFVCTY